MLVIVTISDNVTGATAKSFHNHSNMQHIYIFKMTPVKILI